MRPLRRLLAQCCCASLLGRCSEYAATVFSSGLLRSMSRSGGEEVHSHVGEGHVAIVGMGVWWRADVVAKVRGNVVRQASRMHGAGARERRANV
jgi:hypothetical protein